MPLLGRKKNKGELLEDEEDDENMEMVDLEETNASNSMTPSFKDDKTKLRVHFSEELNREEQAQDLETPPKRKQILVSKGVTSKTSSKGSPSSPSSEPSLQEEILEDENDNSLTANLHSLNQSSSNDSDHHMEQVALNEDDVEVDIINTTNLSSKSNDTSQESEFEDAFLYADNFIDATYADYLKPRSTSTTPTTGFLARIPKINMAHLKWILTLTFTEWLQYVGFFFWLLSTGILVAFPILLGIVIDRSQDSGTGGQDYLNTMILAALGIVAAYGLTTAMKNFSFSYGGERIVFRLRKNLFNALVAQDVEFFDVTKTSELLNRLHTDTKLIENAITVNFSMFLRYSVQIVGGSIFLFSISWRLTLVMLAVVPFAVILSLLYVRFVKNFSKKSQEAISHSTDVAEETFSNLRTVKSFSKEEKHMNMYAFELEGALRVSRALSLANGVFTGCMAFGGNAAILLVLWYAGTLILHNELTIGAFVSFVVYTLLMIASFGALSTIFSELLSAMSAVTRVHNLIFSAPSIERKDPRVKRDDQKELPRLSGHIVLHDVDFSYPSRPNHRVLNGVNLEISPSTLVALVGKAGQGKTTIASLLQRFYDPSEGQITLDGVPLRQIDPVWLRNNLGIVSQEPSIFFTSIRDNIAYGWMNNENEPTEQQIIEAATKANAHEFISSLKDGYETIIGLGGAKLTGSQKQRIGLARAFLKNPKILLFDEHCSSIDTKPEPEVEEALKHLLADRTVLIMAHKLSTIKAANKVCVIDGGYIIEEGTHDELMNLGGLYRSIVEREIIGLSDEQ